MITYEIITSWGDVVASVTAFDSIPAHVLCKALNAQAVYSGDMVSMKEVA